MNKFKEYGMMTIVCLAFLLLTGAHKANAGLLDNIKDAVGGHITDIKDRLTTDNEVLVGKVIQSGTFENEMNEEDFAHYVDGTVSILEVDGKLFVQLNEDFATGLAPDLYVYVSDYSNILNAKFFNQVKQVQLGKLKIGKGASWYELPAGFDVASVTIWCKRFGVYMGSANIYNNQ